MIQSCVSVQLRKNRPNSKSSPFCLCYPIRVEFTVGNRPLNNFRMIERHYFRDTLLKSFDFDFGFCIPNSRNTCEHIYEFPQLSESLGESSSPLWGKPQNSLNNNKSIYIAPFKSRRHKVLHRRKKGVESKNEREQQTLKADSQLKTRTDKQYQIRQGLELILISVNSVHRSEVKMERGSKAWERQPQTHSLL